MTQQFASLLASGVSHNRMFDLDGGLNRDNCLLPYHLLKQRFSSCGIELNTADLNQSVNCAFELHLNVQPYRHPHSYLLQMETEEILPANFDYDKLKQYRRVFTWHDDLVDGHRFIKLNFPNPLEVREVPSFSERDLLVCLISANKSVTKPSTNELYSQRVKTIQWFERHAPRDFELYGIGWNQPQRRSGLIGAVVFKLRQRVSLLNPSTPFPSYRGPVQTKASVLRRAKFSICYENVQNAPGYITEKIFDCFLSGCVPVYWGAPNITKYVPSNCFIDRTQFKDHESLYQHLKSINAVRYQEYQSAIQQYLLSEQSKPFGSQWFAETIVQHVLSDLEPA